jgi:A/G-specific adenine glycosylase
LSFDTKLKQRDPYKILVSEVMAQQTQLSRVILKYEAWLKRFPTVTSLAAAPTREVLLYWSGLGYNRRALYLQKAAGRILDDYKGDFPRTKGELLALPGIGEYTANALLCFAFNEQVAVVDTNVRNVILLEFMEETNNQQTVTEKEIREIALRLLPQGKAYEWNQALMDYSALVLSKDKTLSRSGIISRRTKQSPFRASNRYYRGQIMKLLVRKHTVALPDLWQYFEKENPLDPLRFEAILSQMEKEGLLRRGMGRISVV